MNKTVYARQKEKTGSQEHFAQEDIDKIDTDPPKIKVTKLDNTNMLVELTSDEQGSPLKTLERTVPNGYNSWQSSILYADLSSYWNWVKTIGKARDGEHELTVTDEAGNTTSAYVTMGSRLRDCWIDGSFEGIRGGGWGSNTAKGPFLVNGGQVYEQIVFETNAPQPETDTFDLSGSDHSESTVERLGNQ